MHAIIHGKLCVRLDGRYYAVATKTPGLADRVAAQSRGRSTYQRWQRSARGNNVRGFK